MRLTRAGEYGVRCILYLAGQEPDKVITRREIGKAMEIPHQFLGKIAQYLAKAGFIEIIQGPKGGYRLLVSPKNLTLLDVVEAITGKLYLNDCIMRPNSCIMNQNCTVHRIWEKATEQLKATLQEATFDKLLKEESCIFPFPESPKVKLPA